MTAAAMGWHVLVHNGVVQSEDPRQAATFLRSRPPGAYTTTKTVDEASCMLLWERHLARLRQSIQLLTKDASHPSLISASAVKDLVYPSFHAGLERVLDLRTDGEELVVTLLACTTHYQPVSPSDIFVHISSFVPTPVTPADVAVMGPSRENPLAKCSKWASTRQVLEQCKPQSAAEVILSNDGQHLLEGILTNFFVVVSSEQHERSGFAVQTAALENGVLPGIIRQLIIEICIEKDIPVIEAAPFWDERHTWREAFITSSVRLIQPVRSVRMPVPWNKTFDSSQWNKSSWQEFSLESTGLVTQMLQKEVLEQAKAHGYLISSGLQSFKPHLNTLN